LALCREGGFSGDHCYLAYSGSGRGGSQTKTSFCFETRVALEALLTSTEGRAALAGLPTFATGGYTIIVDEEKVLVPFTMSKS
jgi:hypothetical protein